MKFYCLTLILLSFFTSVFFDAGIYAQESSDSLQRNQIDSLSKANLFLQKQVDSLQKLLPKAPTTPKKNPFAARFYVDASLTRGNVKRDLLVSRAEFVYSGGILELNLNPRYTYGIQNEVVAERDFFTDFNFNLFHQKVLYGFGLGILETSNLRAIDIRWLAGGGVGLHLIRKPKAYFSITNALIYEETDFKAGNTIFTFRNSTRLKGNYELGNSKITLKHLIFVQPSLEQRDNYRWNMLFNLEFPIQTWLRFNLTYEESYESIVSEGRRNNDFSFRAGLVIGK